MENIAIFTQDVKNRVHKTYFNLSTAIWSVIDKKPTDRVKNSITRQISNTFVLLTISPLFSKLEKTKSIESAKALISLSESGSIQSDVAEKIAKHAKIILEECNQKSHENTANRVLRRVDRICSIIGIARNSSFINSEFRDAEEKSSATTSTPDSTNITKSAIVDVEPKILSSELVQSLRNEVRNMVKAESPIDIPLYEGKRTHGDAVAFFKKNYFKYIQKNHEVIFSVDLGGIDSKLLMAIRNECRNGDMPLGSISDRATALLNKRFTDGINTNSKLAKIRWSRKTKQNANDSHSVSV